MNNKLVSVIIPTYKRPDTLDRAIQSVLKQTYKPIEIFVVDDNNPDTEERRMTEQLMEKYKDVEMLHYIQHECNKNGSAARNTGAKASHGEYLAFLDDDDEYLPGKIAAQVEKLELLDDSWGACYCDYIRKSGEKFVSRSVEKREGYIWFHELCRNFWHGGGTGPMVRRSVFEDVGGFDESFQRNQDYEYMLKITKKYKLAHVDTYGHICYVDAYHESKRTFDQVVANFCETFKTEIENLSETDRRRFEQMIALQRFRNYFFVDKNHKKALHTLKESKVSFVTTVRYICYLIYRKIAKVSCGFNI